MKPSYFILLLLLLSTTACPRSSLPGRSIEEILGGSENKAIVESANTVEIYRVFFDWGNVPKSATGRISGFPCLPTPVRFSRIEAERVIASVLHQDTYRVTTLCDFMPGILFRFVSDQSTFDFVVCFACSDLLMSRDGNRVRRAIEFAPSTIGFSGSCWREFATLAKRAFPKDRIIQALGSKKQQ